MTIFPVTIEFNGKSTTFFILATDELHAISQAILALKIWPMRIYKELETLRTQIVNELHGTKHEEVRNRINLLIRRVQWIEWAKNYYKSDNVEVEIRRTCAGWDVIIYVDGKIKMNYMLSSKDWGSKLIKALIV